jgi:spermidine synthase
MGLLFEEIDTKPSELGVISLRRRRIPALGDRDIYEVKLGEEFLMSSMFVDAEIALADFGLAEVDGDHLSVVVGGLGLGYTAEAALKNDRVAELLVVDALDTVIQWHEEEKVPLGRVLNEDPRCRFVHASFFELALAPDRGFDPDQSGRQFDAILLDIDHSPRALLNDANATFYNADSLGLMARQLRPGGAFAMWSNEPPDDDFLEILERVFVDVEARVVSFFNPFQNRESSNTVYVARRAG